jgi:hypothetical protein
MDSKAPRFAFDRTFDFDVSPGELWLRLSDTSSFRVWWPWLRSFDPVPLAPGARTTCAIGPPLPYVVTVDITVREVIPEELVRVSVSRDLEGPARLEIESNGLGSTARLVWEVAVARPALRAAARVARPVLLWGHDWVVNRGVEQFRRDAINEKPH